MQKMRKNATACLMLKHTYKHLINLVHNFSVSLSQRLHLSDSFLFFKVHPFLHLMFLRLVKLCNKTSIAILNANFPITITITDFKDGTAIHKNWF